MHRLLFVVALLVGAQSSSTGQTLKKCDDPKVPIGILRRGTATIWYRLDKNGRPDTAVASVTRVQGMTVSGMRSVATRILGGCRFDVPKGYVVATGLVTELQFDSAKVSLGATNRADTVPTPLAPEPFDLARDSFPLALNDPRIDELPRGLRCPSPQPPSIQTSGRGRTQADAQAQAHADAQTQIDNWNRMNTGRLLAEVVLKSDGRVDHVGTILESTNNAASGSIIALMGECTYAPGRYRGVAVPTRIRAGMVIGPIKTQQ